MATISGGFTATADPNTTEGSGTKEATTETTTGAGESSPTGGNGETEGKFDVGGGTAGVDCSCGTDLWSYLWVANSSAGNVSKIDARTLEEDGRYDTRPGGGGMPSRTSVSLDGRAVVVANRRGGLTKVWARTEFCQDHNGIAGIQTSTGADDVRPWGDDECVAWYTEFPEATNQRPVAWTSGVLDEVSCEYEGQKIWTVTGRGSTADDGMCQGNGIWIHRLDGDTGVVEDTIALPDVPCSTETNGQGPYGGAVDSQNHFWFHLYDQEPLYRVDFETLEVTSFTMPHKAYGIMVDRQDRIWINRTKSNDHTTSVFSPLTGIWASIDGVGLDGGLAEDLEGRVWVADGQAGVMWIDSDTLEVGGTVAIPGPAVNDSVVKGVSVDTDGYVWAIRRYEPDAVRIDPTTFALETYTGLDRPYTYSDMTGSQLSKVACGPAG